MNKKERSLLKQKYGGRCAYCGCVLGDKWHADHIEPVERNDWLTKIGLKENRPPNHPERDVIENMNPSCAPCNIDKHSLSLESWRQIIQNTNSVLMRDSATFRRAVRYNLITPNDNPVVFYFETLENDK